MGDRRSVLGAVIRVAVGLWYVWSFTYGIWSLCEQVREGSDIGIAVYSLMALIGGVGISRIVWEA